MDYEQKLDYCAELMAKKFGISEQKAYSIINYYELEDSIIEFYDDELKEKEEEIAETQQAEIEQNPELYDLGCDIHGGV